MNNPNRMTLLFMSIFLFTSASQAANLDATEADAILLEMKKIPQRCVDSHGAFVRCERYETLEKKLIEGGWCYERVASNRVDAGQQWQPCRDNDPQLIAKAKKLKNDPSFRKAYVFFRSGYIPKLGEQINTNNLTMALYLKDKCELPVIDSEHLRKFQYSDAEGVQEGCWGELLNGRYLTIDRFGNKNTVPPSTLGLAAIDKKSNFFFVEKSQVDR